MIACTVMRIALLFRQSGAMYETARASRRLRSHRKLTRVTSFSQRRLTRVTSCIECMPSCYECFSTRRRVSTNTRRLITTMRGDTLFPSAQSTLEKLHGVLDLELRHQASASTPTFEHKAILLDLSAQLCNAYRELPSIRLQHEVTCPRKTVLEYLARRCCPSVNAVEAAILTYQQQSSLGDSPKSHRHESTALSALNRLRSACTPTYERVLRLCLESDTPLGLQFTMELRSDLQQWLAILKTQRSATHASSFADRSIHENDVDRLYTELRQLDRSLSDLLAVWFAPGMLRIGRVTYDDTPASVIETIAKHEAVHPVTGLDDLKRRLASDRRVFGLFHSLLDKSRFNPVVVLHCSLLMELPAGMPDLHEMRYELHHRPQVAAFYSISNLQSRSLAGIGLGEYLIKQAVALLQSEFHGEIETYCTLSPMPGFRSWLQTAVCATGKFTINDPNLLLRVDNHDDRSSNARTNDLVEALAQHLECPVDQCLVRLIERLDRAGPRHWDEQPEIVRSAVYALAARYLLVEKHRNKPLDAVARFHLANGAELYRINVGADLSQKRWRQSFGCMVNYRYVLEDLHENQREFEQSHRVATSDHLDQQIMRK